MFCKDVGQLVCCAGFINLERFLVEAINLAESGSSQHYYSKIGITFPWLELILGGYS